MGAVERTLIMKLQGTILVLAVLVGQLQCAPSGCRGSEWDNTGHSSGHTTGQSKRSGDPADTDALLPQNWWESKEPMGDGAVNVKRADPADTGAILPTGPSNLPMGDGAISVKRSEGNPADTDALLPQNWWESKVPMGDGAVSVKRADPADTGAIVPTGPSNLPMGDGAVNVKRADPADTGAILPTGPSDLKMGDVAISVKRSPMSDSNPADNLFYPSDDGFSTSGDGDAAINVKRSGTEPRGCRDCEWEDTKNPSGPRIEELEHRRLSE